MKKKQQIVYQFQKDIAMNMAIALVTKYSCRFTIPTGYGKVYILRELGKILSSKKRIIELHKMEYKGLMYRRYEK